MREEKSKKPSKNLKVDITERQEVEVEAWGKDLVLVSINNAP